MPPTLSGRHAAVVALLLLAHLSTAACGAGGATNDGRAKDSATTGGAAREVTNDDPAGCLVSDDPAIRADARAYARDEGIPLDEARRRLRLGICLTDDLADLERELSNDEAGTFAGMWGQRPSEYGYLVLFTRDGEETIRPYLEDEPEQLRRHVEARSGAEATLEELGAAQREVGQVFDHLNNEGAASSTNVKRNRVEVYVKDKARFEAALRQEGVHLPEHVVVLESGLCCVRLE